MGKEYTGFILEDDLIKIARVKSERGKVRLVKLDQFSLVEELAKASPKESANMLEGAVMDTDQDADLVFGLDDLEEGPEEQNMSLDDLDTLDDLDNLDDADATGDEMLSSLDMADEADAVASNEMLLYNILSGIPSKKVQLGLNIPAGNAIFQIIRDINFNEVKKKDLIYDLEDKLESIYGMPKSSDNYAYQVRENGSLILVSIDHEPPFLDLLDRTREMYSGKLFIEDVLPDEVVLVGLTKANYELVENQITGIIQFGQRRCRIVFLKGEEIWLVSPIINEGVKNKNFLNTVFSKILFQLDTGEVSSLDKLILANNSLGEEAVEFFKKNFPDISVEEFTFDEDKFSFEDQVPESAGSFTTAIGLAWAISGSGKERFPGLSLIPSYIIDRQKVFKLQWHGVILLLLLFLSPLTFNYFYQQNVEQIQTLETDLARTNARIAEITPTVNATNQLSNDLSLLTEKLILLDTLSRGSHEWSAKLAILNNGVRPIRSSWFTSFRNSGNIISIDGYTLYRDQVPRIVDIFEEATLLRVTPETMREEQEVYRFTISVKEFTADRSTYSPERPEDLKAILGK